MKSKILISVSLFYILSFCGLAQSAEPDESLNGTYHLLNAERSTQGGTTNQMIVQYADRNGTKMLAAAACEKCTPAVYTFQPEPSKALGLSVFFNSFGIYMIQFDEESFVAIIPDKQLGKGVFEKLAYSNFYSKDKSKVAGMSASKIADYAIKKSKEIMQ